MLHKAAPVPFDHITLTVNENVQVCFLEYFLFLKGSENFLLILYLDGIYMHGEKKKHDVEMLECTRAVWSEKKTDHSCSWVLDSCVRVI